MIFEIRGEAHEGVFSVEEETFAIIEANDEMTALAQYTATDPDVTYSGDRYRWRARLLFAVPKT